MGTEKEVVETTKKVKAGNKTTEVIIGASASKLAVASKSIIAAVEELQKLEEVAATNSLKVVNLEDQIGSLQQELKNQKEQNKIELKNQYDIDRKSFVSAYLTENGFVMIEATNLTQLKTELETRNKEFNADVQKQVAIATSTQKKEFEATQKIAELEYEKKEANNIAELKQLQSEIKMWKDQAESWKDALAAERAAGVERSKASAVGSITVQK
jgi:hypothetical protein